MRRAGLLGWTFFALDRSRGVPYLLQKGPRSPRGPRGPTYKQMRSRSLQIRIAVSFALLLLAVQAAALVLINVVLSQSTDRGIRQELIVGERIFGLLHDESRRQ